MLGVIFHGGRSSVGRAPGCDPGCRGFEPHRSPQYSHVWKTHIYFQGESGGIGRRTGFRFQRGDP
jgi:hypothetical protein